MAGKGTRLSARRAWIRRRQSDWAPSAENAERTRSASSWVIAPLEPARMMMLFCPSGVTWITACPLGPGMRVRWSTWTPLSFRAS